MKLTAAGPRQLTTTQHGEAQWLLARQTVEPRRGGLTASTMPDVCHVGYKTALMRWKIATGKQTELVPSGFLKQLLDYGRNTEAIALRVLEELELLPIYDADALVALEPTGFWVNDEIPLLGATPDGMWCGYGADGRLLWREPVEIKCPKDTGTTLPGSKKLTSYQIQLETQCRITGAGTGHLFVYGDDIENHVEDDPETQSSYYYRHDTDPELWSIMNHYRHFHVNCCQGDIQPPRATEVITGPINRWIDADRRAFNQRLSVLTKYSVV